MVKLAASGMLDTREASATREAYLVKREASESGTKYVSRSTLQASRTTNEKGGLFEPSLSGWHPRLLSVVIRVWEKRYGILQPIRGENRYRNYSDEDIALLRYLKEQTDKGHSIGEMVAKGRDALLEHVRSTLRTEPHFESPFDRLLDELVQLLDPLDQVLFERKLGGAVAIIPFEEALLNILLPLQERVGQLWHDGRASIAIEHYVTKQVQQKLFTAMNQLPIRPDAPQIIVACPTGETHEIGAQTVAYYCSVRGCRVYYLGTNVPVPALADLCRQVTPKLVLISVSAGLADEIAEPWFLQLERDVAAHWPVAIGGSGLSKVMAWVGAAPIDRLPDLSALNRRLLLLFSGHYSTVDK